MVVSMHFGHNNSEASLDCLKPLLACKNRVLGDYRNPEFNFEADWSDYSNASNVFYFVEGRLWPMV